MKKKSLFNFIIALASPVLLNAQTAPDAFSNALLWSDSWIVTCPTAGTTFTNNAPITAVMDACAPAPSFGNSPGFDVWFKFYAQTNSASIKVNASGSLKPAMEVFTGTCGSLTLVSGIAGGTPNSIITLNLTGLTPGQLYYFRVYSQQSQNGTFNFCGTTGLSAGALPVTFSSFNLKSSNNKQELNWTTEAESGMSHYEIEYSNNGLHFAPIGIVFSKSTSVASNNTYSFTDNISRTTGLYRIKVIESNGSFYYTHTVRLQTKATATASVYPNPASTHLTVDMHSKGTDKTTYQIFQSDGRIIKTDVLNTVRTINIQDFAKGVYYLRLNTNAASQVITFEKK